MRQISITLFFVLSCIEYSFLLDEECMIKGLRGRCRNVNTCDLTAFIIATGGVSFCDFDGFEPQICCPNSSAKQESTPKVRPKTDDENQKSPLVKISPADNQVPVSVKKCMEYHQKVVFNIFVTGGRKSLSKQYPHMALIGYGNETNKEWLCGGSLISRNFVLTAAHCITSSAYGSARWVHLGDLDLSTDKDDAGPQDFRIIRIIAHPDYNYPSKYNDIALLELDRDVKLTAHVAPACLQTTKTINETVMTATGWGKTEFAGSGSNFLMTLNLKEMDSKECQQFYKDSSKIYLSNGIIDERMICAGGEIGKDTCEGDSGGPLQIKNTYRSSALKEVSTIVGITSFGKACGLSTSPGVYTRVSFYSKWIESIVWPNDV